MNATQVAAIQRKKLNATSLNNAKQQWHGARNEFGELTYEENRMAEGIATFDKEELREIAADYMDSEMWEVLEMFRKGFGAHGGSDSDKLKMVSYWADMIWDEVEARVFGRLVESGEITL